MEKKIKLKMVGMPNFISMDLPPRPREEGIQMNNTIPVQDLTPEEASEYAEWMKISFLEHWKQKVQTATPKSN